MPDPMRKLRRALPPPERPIETVGDWDLAEAIIGTVLPDDYKAFIDEYGTGFVYGFMKTYNPFSLNRAMNFHVANPGSSECYRLWRQMELRFAEPLRLFPEPGGLLQWGTSGSDFKFHWHTEGAPNDWHVGVFDDLELHEFKGMGFAEFVTAVVKREFSDKLFDHELYEPPPFKVAPAIKSAPMLTANRIRESGSSGPKKKTAANRTARSKTVKPKKSAGHGAAEKKARQHVTRKKQGS